MENEIWKDIEGYEGQYQISNMGRVRSLARISGGKFKYKIPEKLLKLYESKRGYFVVNLSKDGKVKITTIHQLVAKAFIPNPENKKQVNHIDGNKLNNNVINLEWVTDHENKVHAWETGLQTKEVRNKKTYQYSLDGNLITVFNSTLEASLKTKIFETNISACCLEKLNVCNGYVFSYKPMSKNKVLKRISKSKIRKSWIQ